MWDNSLQSSRRGLLSSGSVCLWFTSTPRCVTAPPCYTPRRHIAADLKVREFEIQQLELDLHVSNCLSVGLMAAISASFATASFSHAGSITGQGTDQFGIVLPIAYYVVTYMTLRSNWSSYS